MKQKEYVKEPCRHLPVPPPSFHVTDASIISATKQRLVASQAVLDDIVAHISPQNATFNNVVLPFIQEENRRLGDQQFIEFMGAVSPDSNVRKACSKAETLFAEFNAKSMMRHDFYSLLVAVHHLHEDVLAEDRRLLDKMLQDFRLNGLALSEEDQSRLLIIDRELDSIKQNFLENLSGRVAEISWFTESELEGLDVQTAVGLEQEPAPNSSRFCIKISGMAQLINLLSRLKLAATRRRVYVEYTAIHEANVSLLENAIVLRHEKAVLLGYKSYAELSMVMKMESSPENIETLLQNLVSKVRPATDELLATLRQMKTQDQLMAGQLNDGKFYIWDRSYYIRLMQERIFDIDEDAIAEYFSLHETTSRMLRLFEKIFGLKFVELDDDAKKGIINNTEVSPLVWHEDVRLFAVWNSFVEDDLNSETNDSFLGYLYLDMYARPGKQPGFSDLPIRPGFYDSDGARQYPSTCLVCNFDQPTKTRPTLLNHSLVVLLAHELGHGIHDLVAKTKNARFHGASTAGDFNEAPSQLLESWCWTPRVLRELSCHYSHTLPEYLISWRETQVSTSTSTPEVSKEIAEDVIERLVLSRRVTTLCRTLVLLTLSCFDLAIKQALTDNISVNSTELFHNTWHRIFGVDIADDVPPAQCIDGSYFTVDGMYIYVVSQIYASDMFRTAFKADPLNIQEGLRYRRMILAKGSSEDEMRMLTAFLGHKPSLDAFYQELKPET